MNEDPTRTGPATLEEVVSQIKAAEIALERSQMLEQRLSERISISSRRIDTVLKEHRHLVDRHNLLAVKVYEVRQQLGELYAAFYHLSGR